jgi:hypothetical protein
MPKSRLVVGRMPVSVRKINRFFAQQLAGQKRAVLLMLRDSILCGFFRTLEATQVIGSGAYP